MSVVGQPQLFTNIRDPQVSVITKATPAADLQHLQRGAPQHPAFNPALLKNPNVTTASQRVPPMHHQYPAPNIGRPPISGPPPSQMRQSPHLPPTTDRQPGSRGVLPAQAYR